MIASKYVSMNEALGIKACNSVLRYACNGIYYSDKLIPKPLRSHGFTEATPAELIQCEMAVLKALKFDLVRIGNTFHFSTDS